MRRASRQQRLRHRTIAAWRGVEDGPLIDNPVVTLHDLIPQVLKECKLSDQLRLDDTAAAWRGLSANSATNSAWMTLRLLGVASWGISLPNTPRRMH